MKRILVSILLCLSLASPAVCGPRRAIILRAQFKDVKFEMDEAQAKALADSASAYFTEQLATTVTFDLGPVITLPQDMSYYGHNSTLRRDELIYKAVMETCLASVDAVDFARYDADADGVADNVLLLTAGVSEAEDAGDDAIWPQMNYLNEWSAAFALDGRKIDCFSVSTESAGLRTLCHEYAHSLGLMDLYDTDGSASGGLAPGLWGTLSLMDKGLRTGDGSLPPNFSAVELDILGEGTCELAAPGTHRLEPMGSSRRYLKIPTDVDGEYFLIECRAARGWDADLGCSGLIIYHVDRSSNPTGYSNYYKKDLTAAERWYYNQVNCRPDAECVHVVAALPTATSAAEIPFPQPGINNLDAETNQAFRYRDGIPVPYVLTDISTKSDGSVSFEISEPLKLLEVDVFQDAAILNWEVAGAIGQDVECEVAWCRDIEKIHTSGKAKGHTYTIEGLTPGANYMAIVSATTKDGHSYSVRTDFTTRTYREGSRPYILIPASQRNADGSFKPWARLPLRVANAPDAVSVRWSDGTNEIKAGDDGHFILTGNCTLRAEITNKDGSRDVIIKEVTIR